LTNNQNFGIVVKTTNSLLTLYYIILYYIIFVLYSDASLYENKVPIN